MTSAMALRAARGVVAVPRGVVAVPKGARAMSKGGETDEEFDARYEAYFSRPDIDGWEVRKAMNDLCGKQLKPSPNRLLPLAHNPGLFRQVILLCMELNQILYNKNTSILKGSLSKLSFRSLFSLWSKAKYSINLPLERNVWLEQNPSLKTFL